MINFDTEHLDETLKKLFDLGKDFDHLIRIKSLGANIRDFEADFLGVVRIVGDFFCDIHMDLRDYCLSILKWVLE